MHGNEWIKENIAHAHIDSHNNNEKKRLQEGKSQNRFISSQVLYLLLLLLFG